MASEKSITNSTDGNAATVFLDFINNTKEGMFTAQKPEVIQVTYKRIETQYPVNYPLDEVNQGIPLFGLML